MCPQVEQRFRLFISPTEPIVESEDCLYLNVFVPVDVSIGLFVCRQPPQAGLALFEQRGRVQRLARDLEIDHLMDQPAASEALAGFNQVHKSNFYPKLTNPTANLDSERRQ